MRESSITTDSLQSADGMRWMGLIAATAFGLAMLAAAGWWLTVALLVVAVIVTVSYLRPEMVVPAAIALIYSNVGAVAVLKYGLPMFLGAATVLVLLIPLFRRVAVNGEPIIATPGLKYVIAFATVQVIGIGIAAQPEWSVDVVKTLLMEGLALYLLVTNTVRTKEMLRRVVWALLLVGAGLGLLSSAQFVTGSFHREFGGLAQVENFDPSKRESDVEYEQPRAAGPIGEKNYYAQILLMVLPLGMLQIIGTRSRLSQAAAVCCSLLILCGIAVTFSRGAAFAFGAMMLAMAALRMIRIRYVLPAVAVVIVVMLAVPQFRDRLETMSRLQFLTSGASGIRHTDKATQGRLTEVAAAASLFAEHPLFGVGSDMFPVHFAKHSSFMGVQVHRVKRKAHCLYLQLAAENGIFGIVFFLAMIGVHLRGLWLVWKHAPQRDTSLLAAGFLLAMVAFLATSVFLSFAFIRYFWLMLALSAAAAQIGREEIRNATNDNASRVADLQPANA